MIRRLLRLAKCSGLGGTVLPGSPAAFGKLIAGAPPRYGTWTIFTSAIIWNSSPVRCVVLPLPTEAIPTLLGLPFAYAMNSGTVLAGNDGCTTMTVDTLAILATGAMSRIKLKLSLSYDVALVALSEVTMRSV